MCRNEANSVHMLIIRTIYPIYPYTILLYQFYEFQCIEKPIGGKQMEEKNYQVKRNLSAVEKTTKLLNDLPDYMVRFVSHMSTMKNSSRLTVYEYVRDISIIFQIITEINPVIHSKKDITVDVLDHLNTDDFEDIMLKLQNGYEKNGKTFMDDNASRARKLASIRALYKYLLGKNLITNNPAAAFPSPKITVQPITFLSDDEIALLLDVITTGTGLTERQQVFSDKNRARDMAMVYLMLSTGIRISECVGIDIDDIDWEENSVYLERKGRKFQNVYFDEKCAELLSAYMDEREDMDLNEPTTALFISRNGTRITPRSVQRMVKKYASVAVKNKHITPHKLRSTYATGVYNSTGDIYLVKDALNHKSINTTARYADISEEKRKEASTAAGNWLNNVTN